MLNAGFQYLEQRDANDTITKDGVVGKNSPFATSDNSGIYDIIAEDLRWLKENVDDVKDTSDLLAIKQSVTDMYNTMKNDSSFGEATAKAQAEEAKKQAQAALESATNAKNYYDDITTKSTEVNNTIAEIKSYIEKAEALNESNKALEQSISDSATVATNKANSASDSATKAATSETNAKTSETNAKTSETNAKTSETNAAKSESNAKSHMDATALSETNAKTSETNAKASQTASKTSETNAKASETNASQYAINSSNSADLSKAWAESSDSPDSVNDTDSATGKTQSSKTWALYSRDRAISAFTSETHAKASETNAKTSETNAANSATNSASSATASANSAEEAATSATNAKTSETNATTSASNAKTSETNAKASEINSANSAQSSSDSSDLSKAWSVSTTSPDNIADKDSPTSKTQSSRTWALYSRDRAISAFKSETNAKASETASKTSETNAADSASKAKASETNANTSAVNAATSASNAKASETNAKASETNASASKTDAATSETNAKSYMATAKEYMQKAQEALAAAQAIQSLIDTSKANAEKCLADVEAVKESLAKMITYQGSVDNYSDLPTNPQVGYSYNIKNADKEHGVNAGDNVVWNGTDWDNFGGAIDMSLFAELGKDVKFNTVTATLNGNAATATKLQTSRTISLTGKAAGSTTFDGSTNASINVTSVNADTASKLSTARKINITGNATGAAAFDGTGDISINTTVNESKHAGSADTLKSSAATETSTVARPVWLSWEGDNTKQTVSPNLTYTCATKTLTAANFKGHLAGNADTATKATQDTNGRAFTDTNAYMHISRLANGTDFDNVKTTGIYYCTQDTYTNRPHNSWGILTVYSIGTVKQEYKPDNAAVYYTREYNNTNWTAWSKVAASTADNATTANSLDEALDRPASANVTYNDGKIRYFLATSKMSEGKPSGGDGPVMHLSWDRPLWESQITINNPSGHIQTRTQDNGTWGSWNTILDSENYNNYAPTKTGSGASGTWGINISGTATNADKVDGYHASDILNRITAANTGGITAASLAANGYVKFANGLILQWGHARGNDKDSDGDPVDSSTTFPIAFPSTCFVVLLTSKKYIISNRLISQSKTGFEWTAKSGLISWAALGI